MKKTKKEIMSGVNSIKSKVIANNTIEYYTPEGDRIIRLHLTDIITYRPDGTVILNTGGWKTHTTKDRINAYSPYKVWQQNSIWYLNVPNANNEIKEYTFEDGITIKPNGEVSGEGKDTKQYLKVKKDVKKYVEGFIKALENKKIEKPSGGDCWYCCLHTDKGEALGEATKDKDHILNHFKENYYVPSLLINAIKEIPVSPIANNQIGYWLGYHDKDAAELASGISKDQIKSSLKRYLYRQLGLAR